MTINKTTRYNAVDLKDSSPKVDYINIFGESHVFRVKLIKFEDGIDVCDMTNPKI